MLTIRIVPNRSNLGNGFADHMKLASQDLLNPEIPKTFGMNPILLIDKVFVNEKRGTVVVIFYDGIKTMSKTSKGDKFDFSLGFSLCLTKRMLLTNNVTRSKVEQIVPVIDQVSKPKKKSSKK